MRDNQIHRRFLQWVALPAVLLMYCLTAWADANDPVLPGPKTRGPAEGLGVGSLISSAVMATPQKADGTSGDIVVWGYRKNGHSGNYNHHGHYVGFENNSVTERDTQPRFETVRDFKDPNHPLSKQKVVRLFTTAHTFYAVTEEGEVWSWGDSLHGTAGCVDTGYETGTDSSNRFTDYAIVYNTYTVPGRGSVRGPHYQARPCPTFGTTTPTAQIKKKVAYIDGGEYNAIAITDDGDVYTWGSGTFYQTTYQKGDAANTRDKGIPVNITDYFVDANGVKETVVLVGGAYEGQYAVSFDKNGKYSLWGWGRSFRCAVADKALLAQNSGKVTSASELDTYIKQPIRMTQYDQYAKDIVYINGGYGWTGAMLSDGRVVVTGLNRHIGFNSANPGDGDGQYSCTPRVLMGGNSGYPAVNKLIVRYAGGVAVPRDDDEAIYTWGGIPGGGAYFQVYGTKPVRRQLAGKLKSVGATKEAVFYTTEPNNELYGVGYGDQRVINLCSNDTITWDRDRSKWSGKNSANWYNNRGGTLVPGGFQIRYEDLIDVAYKYNSKMPYLTVSGKPYCDGTISGGIYNNLTRQRVREWTNYDDGRDGPLPPSGSTGLYWCDSNNC